MVIELLPVESLRPHEAVIEGLLEQKIIKITSNDFFHKPIIVDSKSRVILDGHHKWNAARELKLDLVPVYLVDYLNDDSISVGLWKNADLERISKDDVINMGMENDVFGPKTSRHYFEYKVPKIKIPLSRLKNKGTLASIPK
tara:strand:+ start:431 stop:856 length:426 start_codon:yes stop_codon:yes gene_type:complete